MCLPQHPQWRRLAASHGCALHGEPPAQRALHVRVQARRRHVAVQHRVASGGHGDVRCGGGGGRGERQVVGARGGDEEGRGTARALVLLGAVVQRDQVEQRQLQVVAAARVAPAEGDGLLQPTHGHLGRRDRRLARRARAGPAAMEQRVQRTWRGVRARRQGVASSRGVRRGPLHRGTAGEPSGPRAGGSAAPSCECALAHSTPACGPPPSAAPHAAASTRTASEPLPQSRSSREPSRAHADPTQPVSAAAAAASMSACACAAAGA